MSLKQISVLEIQYIANIFIKRKKIVYLHRDFHIMHNPASQNVPSAQQSKRNPRQEGLCHPAVVAQKKVKGG